MNEISNRFYLLDPATVRVALLLGHDIAPDAAAHPFSATGKIVFDQTPSDTAGGVTWNQTFRAVTADKAILQHNGAQLHPAFLMSDGSLRVIGTHDTAPTISVAPHDGGRYLVQASFEAPDALSL